MIFIFYAGVVTALIGLCGILWFIRRARKLRTSEADAATTQAELRALVFLNVAAFGVAFLGLSIAVVGLILA